MMNDNEKKMFDGVFQAALNFLDYTAQTEKTLKDKLLKKEFPEEVIEKVLEKLKELNLINDEEYCRNAVNFLIATKNFGQKKIHAKLRLKGINKELIKKFYEEALNSIDGEDELIKKFINKNIKAVKRLYDKNELQKIRYKLYSNGFSSNAIGRVMKELIFILKDI